MTIIMQVEIIKCFMIGLCETFFIHTLRNILIILMFYMKEKFID